MAKPVNTRFVAQPTTTIREYLYHVDDTVKLIYVLGKDTTLVRTDNGCVDVDYDNIWKPW